MSSNKSYKDTVLHGDVPTETSLGELLAARREQANLSEREAADALKISVSRLKSIEADKFDVFPSETYVKGHLRNYGRLLKCDEQEILAIYHQTKPQHPDAELSDMDTETLSVNNHHKRWWMVYIVLVVLVLIWALSYWIFGAKDEPVPEAFIDNYGLERPIVSESEAVVNPQAGQVANNLKQIELPNRIREPQSPASANSDVDLLVDDFSPSSQVSKSSSLPVEAEAKEQAMLVSKLTASELVKSIKEKEWQSNLEVKAVVVGDTLKFDFAQASWLQVVDADGLVLFKGLNKPGAELALNGRAPFKIIIGNVGGASLVYNGENVSLDAPSGKNTLRLTLGG